MKWHVCICLVLVLSGFSQPEGDARSDSECSSRLKQCFALSASARDACFQKSARDSVCLDTREGALAAKRATFSSTNSNDGDDTSPTPDANIIDRQCVQNFDNLWLSNIVNGSVSDEMFSSLHTMLESCTRSSSYDIMRP